MKTVRMYFDSMGSAMPLVRELTEQMLDNDSEESAITIGTRTDGLRCILYVGVPMNDCIDDKDIVQGFCKVDYEAIDIIRN